MNISFKQRMGYLEAIVTGHHSLEGANRLGIEMLDYLEINHSPRVFVNCLDLQGRNTLLNQYQHAKFLSDQYSSRLMKGTLKAIKFSYALTPHFLDNTGFAENVAENRGFWVKTFNSKDEAVSWLLDT